MSFLILIFAVQAVFSLGISLERKAYYPGQTLQAEISGNFISLSPGNINIYESGVPRAYPVISDLTKQNDLYYFYAVLPNKIGNYTVAIENTQYLTNGELREEPIIVPFVIERTNQSYISVNPGFIVADGDFQVKFKSYNMGQEITAKVESTNISKTFRLLEEDEQKISFQFTGITGNTNLLVKEYKIPIFASKTSPLPESSGLIFSPDSLNISVKSGQNYLVKIVLENKGNKTYNSINLTNNFNAIIVPAKIQQLKPKDIFVINVTMPVPQQANNNIFGEIRINYENNTKNMPVLLIVTKSAQNSTFNNTSPITALSCSGRGTLCVYPETCEGQSVESLEGPCCLGKCNQQDTASNYNWIIGIFLLAIIGVIVYFLYKRSKKIQKMKTSDEILDEKRKKFDRRMNPSPSKEVNNSLGRT